MLKTDVSFAEPASPAGTVLPINSEIGREAGRILAVLLSHLAQSDLEGARDELRAWLNANAWRRGSNGELAVLCLLLADQLADALPRQAQPAELPQSSPATGPGDSDGFSTSTHFSLLTAAIVRQRDQIGQLMGLVDSLARRLA